MHNQLLVNASIVALGLRVAAIFILVAVIYKQIQQFKYKSGLQELKRLLLALVIMIVISNLPIIKLHLDRISSAGGSTPIVTAFATFTNAISMVLIAILLLLIYGFKQKDR